MPTVPRNPSTLTHSVSTTLAGLQGWPTDFYLVKHEAEHPEADQVADRFQIELIDATSGRDHRLEQMSWEQKLVLDMAWTLTTPTLESKFPCDLS